MSDETLIPEDAALETALRSLAPLPLDRIDPLAAAFAAGQRRGRRSLRFWQFSTGGTIGALAVVLSIPMTPPRAATQQPASIAAISPSPSPMRAIDAATTNETDLHRLTMAVLERGLNGLPPVRDRAAEPVRAF